MLNFRKILLFFGDIFGFYLALLLALLAGFGKDFSGEIYKSHLLPFTILYLFWLIIFYILGLYDLDLFKTPSTFYLRILIALGLALTLGIFFFYLLPFFGISPKTNLILDVVIFGIFVFLWRKFFYYLFSTHFQNKVAIVGKNPQSEKLAKILEKSPYLGYKLVGFLEPKENIFEKIQEKKIDTLILAEAIEGNPHLAKNLYQCLPLKINFLDLSQAYEIIFQKIPVSFVSKIWFLENIKEREKGFYEKLKRIIDVVLAALIIIITLPLWSLIALAIKLEDRGPVLYKQKRVGENEKEFVLLKFRSMIPEAEKEGPKWAEKEDERITKIGGILRRLHLDELPQMINILKGDISLVGPRPERPEFVKKLEKEIPHYQLRHLIKPGFTGWAQIKFRYGRSVMDAKEKLEYDLYYLKNRNLLLDLSILLKTFQLLFKRE